MFTDLVGSTRLREVLGDDVADEVGVEHDRIIGAALSSTGGRLVKNLGDGALVVFDSSVDAVVAGQRIQEGVSLYNRLAGDAQQISVRVGINAGEIGTNNGDVIGLPVAVASRVCDAAGGGQILVTDTVRLLIGRRARFPLVSIGAHTLKGMDSPVELWSVEDAAHETDPGSRGAVPFPAFLERAIPEHLVGREEQLSQLDAAYAAAATSVQLAVVIGEPGIGKTSLTSLWCRTAGNGGAVVVAGRCTPDAALPYQPFVEVARAVLGANPRKLLEVGPAAGNVARLVPGIHLPRGLPVPIQTDPDTTQHLMAEAFAALFKPTADEPPSVVVLDDLHWADEHSIAVLAHLARRDETSALVVGTYRDTDLVRSHPLPKLLVDLRRDHRVVRIPLERLSDGEVEEMIRSHFGSEAAPEIVESIADETQGNPFFVEEITSHLEDEGAIDVDGRWISETPIDDYGIPEGVREVIGRRVEHLGDDVVSTLEVASVIGPDFSIDVAGAIAGLDERAVDRVVDAAMNARVIDEGDGADEFVFAHALLRQTLYDDLPTRRRTRLHRAVGEALERREAPPATLINHWLNADRPDKALVSSLAAATAAEAAFAMSNMAAHLELALDLWDDVDNATDIAGTSHADLVLRLTRAHYDFGGRNEEAMARVAVELEDPNLDDRTRALLHNSMSRVFWLQGRGARSLKEAKEALRLVPKDEPNAAHAEILGSVASQLNLDSQYSEAIETAREALRLARVIGTERTELGALAVLATATGSLGEVAESNRYFEQLAERAQASGVLRAQLVGYVNQGETLAENGYVAEGLELTERGIVRTRELGLNRWEAALRPNAARFLFLLSRWDEAEEHLTAMTPSLEVDLSQIHISLALLDLAAERGDEATMQRELDRLGSRRVEDMHAELRGPYWASRVSDLRWRGQYAQAYELASEALATIDGPETWLYMIDVAASAIETVADAVDAGLHEAPWIDRAVEWHARFDQYSKTSQRYVRLRASATADLARARGNNDSDLWRAAIETWTDAPYWRAKSQWRLAESLAALDPDDPEVSSLLAEVERVAAELGAKPLLDAAKATREAAAR
jgi:class 3 adenylate cyclase/tetratricopeptide (TPR) repeat protein